ncbi:gallate 1-beta-glucosyltransferase-like [Musa acuminata AAA Group]|uniref:gallate 1-beta-glucosyltransferase-like n=1 Tax=Musa acuminata AAA Group TaxID=214697 RepID=UPI0031D0E117
MEGDSGSQCNMPHLLMVSFAAQGHLNPLLRLAKRIAANGLLVTLCSTDDIRHRISSFTANAALGNPTPVGRGFIRFEFFSDSLAVDDPRRGDLDFLMPLLRATGPPALADLIRRHVDAGRPVSCVVNNPFLPWVLDVAADLGIPSGVLWVQSCAVFTTYYCYYHSLVKFPTEDNPNVTVNLPGLPPLKAQELPSFLLPSSPYKVLAKVILEQFANISKASWVLANSFEELEHEAIDAISHRLPLIPVGPLVEPDHKSQSSNIRSDIFKAGDCMEWLETQAPLSVVYVSVGSVVVLSKEEMEELAWGLKDCGRPFLWVVRSDAQALLPEGFIEAAAEPGLVVAWSPQDRVLAHPAIACFVTHCGWNSTLEALTAGVPVVTYPQWGDQVPGSKFLVEVYGVGVRLRSPAAREEVERCVDAVTRGEGAEAIRGRAAEWREAATKAVAEGGSSDRHIQAFVDEIRKRAPGGGHVDSDGTI